MSNRVKLPAGKSRQAFSVKGSPADFGRLGRFSTLENVSWSKIPTYYYDFRRFELPLTDDEATQEFGRNIPIFDNQGVAPVGGRQTNAAIGSGVNEPFVALGAGVIAMGEGEGFSINGASVTTPTEEGPTPILLAGLPNLFGIECYCGSVDLTQQPVTTRLATLWWGAPTWRFIEKFFQAYRLQITINARFQLVDESLFDVGMTPVSPEFIGASDSQMPTMPFINAVNGVMLKKDIGQQFLPANTLVAVIVGEEGPQVISGCLPPPLAAVTYGHPRIIGLANRIYCFNQPLVFLPGLRFEVEFVNVEDISVYTALRNTITANCTTAGDRFTQIVESEGVRFFDQCAANCTIPGGSVSLGVVFKGYALWPEAVVEYFTNYMLPQSAHAAMYAESGSAYLSGILGNPEYNVDVRNAIAGNLGMKPEQVVRQ